MIEFDVPCPNPFDGRPSAVHIRLTGEDRSWFVLDFLKEAVRQAFTAAGRAWWDSRCVYCSQPGQFCEVPWFRIHASEIVSGTWSYAVPINMDMVDVSISDRTATLAPRGYPPNASFYLSEKPRARVRERMEMNFGTLLPEVVEKIYKAFGAVYIDALVKDKIELLSLPVVVGLTRQPGRVLVFVARQHSALCSSRAPTDTQPRR